MEGKTGCQLQRWHICLGLGQFSKENAIMHFAIFIYLPRLLLLGTGSCCAWTMSDSVWSLLCSYDILSIIWCLLYSCISPLNMEGFILLPIPVFQLRCLSAMRITDLIAKDRSKEKHWVLQPFPYPWWNVEWMKKFGFLLHRHFYLL